LDTSVADIGAPARPVKFTVRALTDTGEIKLKFKFFDKNSIGSGTIDSHQDYIEIRTATKDDPTNRRATWKLEVDTTGFGTGSITPPTVGDKYELRLFVPFTSEDKFTFLSKAGYVDPNLAKSQFEEDPYVVPNPYVGAASFEPQRFAVSEEVNAKLN